MSETITRDLAGLAQTLRDEADQCEQFGITKPAALLREAAAVIQVDANSDAMDMFAEVTSVGHLADLVDSLRMSMHHQADEWADCEELNGAACAATLRQIAGDHKPHPKLPLLPHSPEHWRETGIEEPQEGQQVLAVIYPYNNASNAKNIVHALYYRGAFLDAVDGRELHRTHHWMPAPVIPGA